MAKASLLRYCRVIDAQEKAKIKATDLIEKCPDFMRCSPYEAGTVVFLFDMTRPTAEMDIAALALAKHEICGQQIWRVDFSAAGLSTESDRTPGALASAIVSFGAVNVRDASYRLMHAGKIDM